MKSVLISIQPKWCEMIASGKKTIEIRKTMPKLETPFKCYIYCTSVKALNLADYVAIHARTGGKVDDWSMGVVGEFTCDRIDPIHVFEDGAVQNWMYAETDKSGLTYEEVAQYVGLGKTGYVWHISDLRMYQGSVAIDFLVKPGARELDDLLDSEDLCKYCYDTDYGEKRCYGTPNGPVCCEGAYCDDAYDAYLEEEFRLTRPPQSWCYIESFTDYTDRDPRDLPYDYPFD